MNEPRPSPDPVAYRCPRCRAEPAAPCGVLPEKVTTRRTPHTWRVDAMLAAHSRWAKADAQ